MSVLFSDKAISNYDVLQYIERHTEQLSYTESGYKEKKPQSLEISTYIPPISLKSRFISRLIYVSPLSWNILRMMEKSHNNEKHISQATTYTLVYVKWGIFVYWEIYMQSMYFTCKYLLLLKPSFYNM